MSSKVPRYCMFLDWYSKNAPVIQLLGNTGGGLINFLLQKGGGLLEREAYLRGGELNRGFVVDALIFR